MAMFDSSWTKRSLHWMPSDDVPLLSPCDQAAPGYELVLSAIGEPHLPGRGDGYSFFCLWDIWNRKDDPALRDPEKAAINQMQRALPALDDDARYVRIQIACVQRCWWDFPRTLDLIIDGIGSGRVNLGARISCEPPWSRLLLVLRRRRGFPGQTAGVYDAPETNFDPLHAPRQRLARAYIQVLTWWTFSGDLACLRRELPEHTDLADQIYQRLGPPTKLKLLRVEKLRIAIGWQAFPGSEDYGPLEHACKARLEILDAAIAREVGAATDTLTPLIHPRDLCHHAFFRHLDRSIANIGTGTVVPLPGSGEERVKVLDRVANYAHALGSWLAQRTPAQAERIWPSGARTVAQVYDVLGQPTPLKRWLVASLRKKLDENHARHGRGALDTEPQRFALPVEVLRP